MSERYLPPSRFLRAAIEEEVAFGELDLGETNLLRLLTLTADEDGANRDWATFLLAQLQMDRPDVRKALLNAASDEVAVVRGEAILGIAQLDRALALSLLQQELKGNVVTIPLMEAAALVADCSLVDDLEAFSAPSEDKWVDQAVDDALVACRNSC